VFSAQRTSQWQQFSRPDCGKIAFSLAARHGSFSDKALCIFRTCNLPFLPPPSLPPSLPSSPLFLPSFFPSGKHPEKRKIYLLNIQVIQILRRCRHTVTVTHMPHNGVVMCDTHSKSVVMCDTHSNSVVMCDTHSKSVVMCECNMSPLLLRQWNRCTTLE